MNIDIIIDNAERGVVTTALRASQSEGHFIDFLVTI